MSSKGKFIRLSYETFRALVAKKCVNCPLRDGCPDVKKQTSYKRTKAIAEEVEEIRTYFIKQ